MASKLYVGNLSYNTTDTTLSELFAAAGEVRSVEVIMDRATGQSKGFAFVEMADQAGAQKAISELDGREVDGRALKVAEARPREDRRAGGGDRPRRW